MHTYRTWDALALGAIPIVLHSTMDRTFSGLPVLLVDNYSNLTAPMLQKLYKRFVSKASQWDFSRLTTRYWADLMQHVLETGSSALVQSQHPISAGYKGHVVTPLYHPLETMTPGI